MMAAKKYDGVSYHVWNQWTDMDEFMAYFGAGPEVIVRGEGSYLFNQRGTRYINGVSCLWNVSAGLGRAELVEAAGQQMRELPFCGSFTMVHPRAIELAARLVELTGGHYQHVMFGSNGSDGVEIALKLARQYHRQSRDPRERGRYKIFSLRGSYHGFSYGCLSTSGYESDAAKFGPLLPGFVQVEPPYCYRCPFGKNGFPECGLACAQALEEKILAEGPETAAAVIIEPVMGDFGIVAGPDEYYARVGEICRRYGLLLIADEVTTGFGRTGRLFATQSWDPKPDILILGKAITNGYFPLSATLVTEAIYDHFHGEDRYFPHGISHGGHPVGCAVALAAIKIIIDEKLPENAARVGAYLKTRLEALSSSRPQIGEVRGRGLMLAIELVKDRQTKEPLTAKELHDLAVDAALLGLLVSTRVNQIRLVPPLIMDEALADEMVRIIDRALDKHFSAAVGKKARMLKEFAAWKTRPQGP
jgi:adenosylmethionine-8-amino-7-oxononanoate aminotransferase